MSVLTQGSVLGLGVQRHQLAGRGVIPYQPRAGQTFQPGSAVVHRDGVQLAEVPTARTDLVSLGTFIGLTTFTASSTADANGGAVDPVTLQPQSITIHPFDRTGYFVSATGADLIVYANVDQPCYWVDDGTLALTDASGTRSFAGYVDDVIATGPWAGYVVLRSNLEIRGLYDLISAGETPGPAVTSEDRARLVATNIPAGTFAAGVFTVTATGAFPTQDGVAGPLAIGDKLIFPLGTITTQVVSAANSGPYEVVTVGATGVQAVFARPARWSHVAVITPETVIKVGGEGTVFRNTVWRAGPLTNALAVGTGDPLLCPDRVTQSVLLVGGTYSVTNVPIRNPTGGSGWTFSRTTATGTTLTTGGYGSTSFAAGGVGGTGLVIIAEVAAGTINTADGSTGLATITN